MRYTTQPETPTIEVKTKSELDRETSQALGAFTIMSMNVNGQPNWYPDEPKKQWSTRAPLVRDVVTEETPEIIGFQEFGETTKEDVFDQQSENPYSIYKGRRVGEIFINPIAWDNSRFRMRERLTRWLTPDGKFGTAWDANSPRGYSAVLLEDQTGGGPVWIYNSHLDNVSAPARFEATKKILQDIDDRTDNLPVAITGDLNAATWPMPAPPHEEYYDPKVPASARSDQELFKLLEAAGFDDTNPSRHIPNTIPQPTFHGYLGENVYRQPDRFGVWDPDAIFVRGLATTAFKIITTHHDGSYPSDHYPIKATVSANSENNA